MLSPSVSPAPAVLGLGVPIPYSLQDVHPMAQPRLCHNSVQGEFSQLTLQNGFNCPPQLCFSLEMEMGSGSSEGPPAGTSVPGDTREGPWSREHFGDSQDMWLSFTVLQPWWDRQTDRPGREGHTDSRGCGARSKLPPSSSSCFQRVCGEGLTLFGREALHRVMIEW